MKKSELKQLIKEEIKRQSNNDDFKLKLKRAIESLKRGGKIAKREFLEFLEGFLRNIDD